MRDTGSIGDKLLPKIIHAVSQAVITTKRGLMPWDHYVRVKASQDIIDKIGHEIAEHYGPFVDLILQQDTSAMHPAVRKYLEDSRSGKDQLKAVSGLLVGGAQSAIGTFLSNELAPFVYAIVALNPHLDVDPNTAALAVAQRQVSYAEGERTAAEQGFGAGVFATLADMAHNYPAIADALEMRRRNYISDAELTLILERNQVPQAFIDATKGLTAQELSLADAALAYLRSDITLDEARSIAHANGYTDAQLNVFLGNVGEPPGEQQLAEALRRKFISEAEFVRGVKQSRIRNEWIPTLLALRYAPMSVADAVNAVVQNHISMAEGAAIADQNGLEASAFPVLYQTAGEPLSRTELEELYNRRLIPQSVVEQGLRESRLKNKYVADAFALHERLLEPRLLSSAVETGAISHADAIAEAMKYGFSQANAEVLVNEGSARKLKTYRERVVSAAEGLYEENAISRTEFTDIAKAMGFDASEAEFVYQSAEYRRQSKAVTAVVNAIRSKYIGHHITHSQASGFLDSLGVVSDRRDYLLNLWQIEAAANVKQLTTAQIVKAVKLELMTAAEGAKRLVADGYTEGDAKLLLEGA